VKTHTFEMTYTMTDYQTGKHTQIELHHTQRNRDACIRQVTEWQRKFGLSNAHIVREYENETA